jgi:O-antigen/teichoic acid export membrane protein
MFFAAILLLATLLWYSPEVSKNLIIIIIGTFAFVFGLFSILMGYFQREERHQGTA